MPVSERQSIGATSVIVIFFKAILADLAGAVIWWYGGGLKAALWRFRHRLDLGNEFIGWSIWLTHLMIPMYGQTDLSGRLISFVVRLVQSAVRTIAFACWALGSFILLVLYAILPCLILVAFLLELTRLFA